MEENIKIALVQASLIWESPKKNRDVFSKKIVSVSMDVDVIILPEMFTSGFTMCPDNILLSEDEATLTWMRVMAQNSNAAIVGSIIYREGIRSYNRLFFVKPDGSVSTYDKRHTFTLAGEHEKYTAGTKQLLVNYKGFTFCPLICYDLRFPVWSRNTMAYDVLLYVANWPKPRVEAWDALLRARAIENMTYCVGVNRIGTDANGHSYLGHSGVYDALGKQLLFSEDEEVLEVTLSKKHITETRQKLGFLNDRDGFSFLG
jgi:predicted amidohydrolase